MKALRATPHPRGWQLSLRANTRADADVRAGLGDAIVRGREQLLAWYRQADGLPEAWRLEGAKAAIDDGEIALGLADRLTAQCVADPRAVHEVCGPEHLLSLRSAALALRAAGQSVAGGHASPWRDRLGGLGAGVAAVVAWTATLLRGDRGVAATATSGHTLFALHGEQSTRTKHLLALLVGSPKPATIIVLGRPRLPLATLREAWQRNMATPLPTLVRPYSWGSALRSFASGAVAIARGAAAAPSLPWLPPQRERIAQAYRCLFGAASARWWLDRHMPATTVVFGHTGLADTNTFERAIQRSGSRTVHAVHGLSGGLNFVGHSNVAVWRSGFDADWHREFGSYGHCTSTPCALPATPAAGTGVLVLSNLAHPMNPAYALWGAQPEIDALAQVAALAPAVGGEAWWKPHPSFRLLPAAVIGEVERRAAELGLRQLAADSDVGDAARRAARVFCTPSTIFCDVLLAGRVPELVGDRCWTSHVSLRSMRFATDAGAASAAGQGGFGALWQAIRPAAPLALDAFHNPAGTGG